MSSQKDRIKKNIKGFLGYIEKRREHRKTFLIPTIMELTDNWQSKEFYLEFDKNSLVKKSKNLQSFLHHRKSLDRFNKQQWIDSVYLPYVMRFHNSNISKNINSEIKEHIENIGYCSLGCHNLADRISITNPKKILSVRTRFSFPHYGIEKDIREKIGNGIEPVVGRKGRVKSIMDNGKCWINHSINLVKGEDVLSQFIDENYPDATDEDRIPKWSEKNPELYNLIGNGVVIDFDLLGFANMGLYYSYEYKGLSTFSFEDFTEEELSWVSDWLDWEYLSLWFGEDESVSTLHYFNKLGEGNFITDLKEAVNELADEIGVKTLGIFLIRDFLSKVLEKTKMDAEVYGIKQVSEALSLVEKGFENNKEVMLESWNKLYDDLVDGIVELKQMLESKFDFDEVNLTPTIKLTEQELNQKRRNHTMGFLDDRFDFQTGKVSSSENLGSGAMLQRYIERAMKM